MNALIAVGKFLGKFLLQVGLKMLLDKNLKDRTLLDEVEDSIRYAEKLGKEQGLKGQDKMKVALERIKSSTISSAKAATESELRTLIEMKLDKLL